ncbi:TMEM128 family protein [Mycoplasmopsis agassizii]|uniref:Preprotein translocase subunit SecE n=1 Tax=Mycoplasmopsis agassizii TaxID=33922 RepID=A0ABX4H479_9BACT|nr:TMEM128 family protein [Mycoplasmopsis agassizii]PAF54699.1 hypothetical protein CJF60_03090 [Mycoplasmopsis agassizii]SMC15993.1 hypothetical protein SAMN02745179_00184 [Mycoplasmopsis agassizii]
MKNLIIEFQNAIHLLSNNPFYQTSLQSINVPRWLALTAGIILIVFGLLILLVLLKTVPQLRIYKQEQMDDYYKKVKKAKAKTYEQTGMYVSWNMRIRTFWPIFVSIASIMVGVVFCVGSTISTL